jgi:hypothetical protein
LLEQELMQRKSVPLTELKDVINFSSMARSSSDPAGSALEPLPNNVRDQLQKFIQVIATMYLDHPFHCFEVCMIGRGLHIQCFYCFLT